MKKVPAINMLNAFHVFKEKNWVPLENAQNYKTPQSDYFYNTIQPIIRPYLPDPHQYEIQFDIFEYLIALVYTDMVPRSSTWAPVGRFARRYSVYTNWQESPPATFIASAREQGEDAPLLRAGFFRGSLEQLDMALTKHNEFHFLVSQSLSF